MKSKQKQQSASVRPVKIPTPHNTSSWLLKHSPKPKVHIDLEYMDILGTMLPFRESSKNTVQFNKLDFMSSRKATTDSLSFEVL